jgi:hypothetical protein
VPPFYIVSPPGFTTTTREQPMAPLLVPAPLRLYVHTCSVRTDYEKAVHNEPRQTRTVLLVLVLQSPRLIALSLTSDLNGIFLCKIFGAGIGNLTVGFLIPRHDRPTLLFYITASLPNILPLHFAELLALL